MDTVHSWTASINIIFSVLCLGFICNVPFKSFRERNCEFPCEFQWTSQDVSQINDEFIFPMPSGKKNALVFLNFQVKNWGRERSKALKIHFSLAWIFSYWASASGLWKMHGIVYIHDMFPKSSAVAVTEFPDMSTYISSLNCPKTKN